MSTADTGVTGCSNPDNDDYDSDVLEDSSSDEGDHNSKTCDVRDFDDEDYGNFLRSVFCDDEGEQSSFSLADEDDEEEYRPQYLDSNDDEDYDDDDDGDDDGLIKVARRELEDLVDGCWQTIAGEPLHYASSESSANQKKRGLKRGRSLHATDENSFSKESSYDGNNSISNSVTKEFGGRPNKLPSPHRENPHPPPPRGQGQQIGGQSLISNLVRQIFSGEKPSAVCLDGMPVDAIRKLVARQMSMASQLLVQMLVSSEDRSSCFSSCYTSLMELSNQRENALKRAALMQMNMKNLKVAAFQKIAQLSQQPSDGIDSSPAEMRLTRAVAERQSKALGSSSRSTSLFDVPMLVDITELFQAIDLSRREMKAHIAKSSTAYLPRPSRLNAVSAAAASIVATDDLFRSRSDALTALKTQMERIASPTSATSPAASSSSFSSSTSSNPLSALTKMRVWKCLIPTASSPLGGGMMMDTDPSSLIGRSLFTPAEDDLLLRGIIKYGEDAWDLIKRHFLPSKEEQLLQFRFRQMTSPTAKEASKFKRYTALEKSCRGREEWTHEEDLDLLRGYQIYGDKWPLISIFFFPHRCRKELKARWQAIQKHWERAFSGNLDHITFKTEMSASSKMLLHFLKESSNSNSNSNVSTSPMRSAAILQYQSVAHSAVGSEVEGRVKSGDTESYGDENGDGVDEDILADSDEEDGEKDLDWHLGRLTRRQSVLSQWSRSLSSTAAIYCGPKREGAAGTRSSQSTKQTVRPDPTLTSRRVPTTAPARKTVSATTKAHVPIHIPSSPPNSTLRHKKSPEKLLINSKNNDRIVPRSPTLMRVRLGDERVGLRSSSNTPRKVKVGVPNDAIIEGNSNISIVGDQRPGFEESIPHEEGSMSVYPELCEFTNFSNITMILDNAKVLMQGNEERDIMHDKALNSNIGKRSLLNSMGGGGASSRSGSRKLVSSHAPMTGSHASSTQNGLLSASASARTGAGAGGMQAGQVTGLFAAVMKDQNSTSTRC